MKKLVCLILAMLLALATLTPALAVDKDAVKAAQQALNDAGYNCGTPDGIAGKKTAAAVSQYQEDNGLEVTGEIDVALLAALGLAEEAAEDAVEEVEEAVEEVEEEVEEAESDALAGEDNEMYNKPENFAEVVNEYMLALSCYLKGYDTYSEMQPYMVSPMYDEDVSEDGHVTQEFMGEKATMMVIGTKLGDDEYGPLTEVTYTLQGKETEEINLLEMCAIVAVLVRACGQMGVDEAGGLADVIGSKFDAYDFDNDVLSTADWDRELYTCDAYTVQYEYINEGSKPYEQEIKLTITAGQARAAAPQADEAETDANADTGTGEAEADVAAPQADEAETDAAADAGTLGIPQELVRATGGLPERIDDLENRYSIGGIKALYANWETEGPAALTSLVESGSCEVNTFGYDFMPSTIVTLPSKTSIDIDWSLSWSNVLSISLQQPLPEDNIDEAGNEIEGYCMTLLRFDEAGTLPTIVVEAYKYLNDPSREIETALTVWYSVGDVGDYTSVVCGISMGAGQSDSVSLRASLDNTRYLWTGYYDPSGSLIDTEVETVALS